MTRIEPVQVLGSGIELPKRTYLPFKVMDTCPKCGQERTLDLTNDYLSYPTEGQPANLYMTCVDKDGHECSEWTVRVVVGFTLALCSEDAP